MRTLKEVLQRRGESLWLPTIYLVRDNRHVVLAGMMHLASIEFFRHFNRTISFFEARNFHVMYEDLYTPPAFRSLFDEVTYAAKFLSCKTRLKELGLEYQADAIPQGLFWESADLSKRAQRHTELTRQHYRCMSKEMLQRYYRDFDQPERIALAMCNPHFGSRELPADKMRMPITRHAVGIGKILRRAEARNVFTFWGAQHIPDMLKRFEKAGFQPRSVAWTEALNTTLLRQRLAASAKT